MRRENGKSFFYQWEKGQKLIVEENCTEVHYYNGSRKNATVCEVKEVNGIRVADVPNDLLQVAADLHAYAWNSFAGSVVGYRVFGVQPKARPDDYVYTPTQVKSYDSLVEQFEKHGAYYMPQVSEDGQLQWEASVPGLPVVPGGNIRGPAVLFTDQKLSEKEKAQARKNIGALSSTAVIVDDVLIVDVLVGTASIQDDVLVFGDAPPQDNEEIVAALDEIIAMQEELIGT